MTAPDDQAPDAPVVDSPATDAPVPEISAQEAAEIKATNQQNKRTALIGGLFIVILVVVVIVLLLWLRGCGGTGQATTKPASTDSSATVTQDAAILIENRVHSVLHPLQLANKNPLCTTIYIIQASKDSSAVVATIRLVASSADINKALGPGAAHTIASTCEKTALAGVPEVDTIKVVDFNSALISSQSRQ